MATLANFVYFPTNEERSYAMLAHIVGIFFGFLAPVIMILIKKDSRFVLFHSLQSLIWHFLLFVFVAGGALLALAGLFAAGVFPPDEANAAPPASFMLIFGFVWLCALGGGITTLVIGISTGIKANRGEWAKYPLLGNFVMNKLLFDFHH